MECFHRRLFSDAIDDIETGLRAESHSYGNRAIYL